ncbi:hypothetical protein LUZ63_006250 [Rhynchospora breviuscula]|uniref:DUF7804 domain-containing protein n=1 Tax=Rhynchospora breviuscula TaxID=2022672 RepID=A0A9Q0HTY2_9POAL|nr:hypothetical protein LUZ63_006250 [Rhynchospora breviuscula]
MASTSFASNLTNTRVRSWFLSPDKAQGRVTFLPLRQREGFRPQAALMAMGPTSSSSETPIYKPLLDCLPPLKEKEADESDQEKRDPITDENLDEWIKDSVTEIVKNIGEAPFLMQIFSRGGRNKEVRVEREAATPDVWPQIKKRWSPKKSNKTPDGIILVNELRDVIEEEQLSGSGSGPLAGSNRVWGLVVQGRGMECVSCYILNTCRVLSPAGSCTHFCLARAQCFGDPVELQLRNAWLQSRRR